MKGSSEGATSGPIQTLTSVPSKEAFAVCVVIVLAIEANALFGKLGPLTTVKGVIHWVSASEGHKAEVRLYDRLFTVPNPAAEENFLNCINPDSLVTVQQAFIEPALVELTELQAVQFERLGYFCRDNHASNLVFNRTVGLRDSWAKIEAKEE